MRRKPIGKPVADFHIQPITKQTIQLPDRLSNRRSNGRRGKFAQFRDQGDVIHAFLSRVRERVHGTEDVVHDGIFELPILSGDRIRDLDALGWIRLWSERPRRCPLRELEKDPSTFLSVDLIDVDDIE